MRKKLKKFNKKSVPFKFKNAEDSEYTVYLRKPHPKYNALGLCDHPDDEEPKIHIDPTLLERQKLAVALEEFFHAHAFEKTEKVARKFAANTAKYLLFLGYRLEKKARRKRKS
jgi:hypothetical protein